MYNLYLGEWVSFLLHNACSTPCIVTDQLICRKFVDTRLRLATVTIQKLCSEQYPSLHQPSASHQATYFLMKQQQHARHIAVGSNRATLMVTATIMLTGMLKVSCHRALLRYRVTGILAVSCDRYAQA